ncbi:ATP-binding protein, partial [Streptomyces nanshensis]|uniref:ATP-binding protein n=1 Tax=Streptomyces nanshensis TaxID=518642 RepID=UPI00085BC45F
MTDTPVALIVFLALGTVAVVLALLLVRSRQELGRSQLHTEATETELESAGRYAADLSARLQAVEGELRHLVDTRIPELTASLAHSHVPVPGPLGTATLSPELDRCIDAVLAQVREEVVKERHRVDTAAQAAMRGATTTIQALLYQLQTLLQRMQEKYEDPLVAEDLLAADFLNEQALRRIQSTAVVCGAWPGLTRENSHLADVVVGASSRLSGYERVQVTNLLRDPVGVVARAVEPVAVTLTELMANALHYSHPELPVTVTLQQGNRGASVIIDDAGVGMTAEELARAKRLMSGGEAVLITELGDPPRTGFATVGQLVRQYGFSTHAEISPYGGVRTVLHIPGEPLLTLLDEAEHPMSAMSPTPPYGTPVPMAHVDAAVETEDAAREPSPSAAVSPAGANELPRRRRRRPAAPEEKAKATADAETDGTGGGPGAGGPSAGGPGADVPGGEVAGV